MQMHQPTDHGWKDVQRFGRRKGEIEASGDWTSIPGNLELH
jgi:hypothetical protein